MVAFLLPVGRARLEIVTCTIYAALHLSSAVFEKTHSDYRQQKIMKSNRIS